MADKCRYRRRHAHLPVRPVSAEPWRAVLLAGGLPEQVEDFQALEEI